jgi:uncharacterized protein (TIGR03066 family)
MMRSFAALAGLTAGLSLTAFARADDKKTDDFPKLIVAKWEISKAGGEAPAGTVLEFSKDNNVTVVMKMDGKEVEFKGTYKLDKDKLTVKMKYGEVEGEEKLTIKKLTDDAMELEDMKGGVDVLKKKK